MSIIPENKDWLILDCSHLNDFIDIPSIKFDDYKVELEYFKEKGWMIAFDLKDGYNQISIHKDFRQYLYFQFEHEGKIYFARYVCGCFGLRDLPYVFIKVFRVLLLVKHFALPVSLILTCPPILSGFCT